jgi:hypothetical protein
MIGLIPKISLEGFLDYILFGFGVSLGAVIFSKPMEDVESFIANLLQR